MKATARKDTQPPRSAREGARTRIPNAERSAAMRAKILKAAIECLCEVGYHNTSTVLVTEKAGVSRGAMLHHFPSKAELILATFSHIRTLRRDAHDSTLSVLKTDREKFLHLIDMLWETFNTPAGVARLEIMIGGRSDPDVAPALGVHHHDFLDKHHERVHLLAESLQFRDRVKLDAFVMMYIAALRGLMMETFYRAPHSAAKIDAAIAMMKDFQLRMLDEMSGKA